MWKIQFGLAKTILFVIWCQAVPPAVHLWRMGDHFEGGFLLTMTTALALLGALAINTGIRVIQKEGTIG